VRQAGNSPGASLAATHVSKGARPFRPRSGQAVGHPPVSLCAARDQRHVYHSSETWATRLETDAPTNWTRGAGPPLSPVFGEGWGRISVGRIPPCRSRSRSDKGGATPIFKLRKDGPAVIFQHVVPILRPYERRRRRSGAKVQIGCIDLQGADLPRRLLHRSIPEAGLVGVVSMGTTS